MIWLVPVCMGVWAGLVVLWLRQTAAMGIELAVTRTQLEAVRASLDYWQGRAERLIDERLLRDDKAVEPIMRPVSQEKFDKDIKTVFAALGVREINLEERSKPS